MNWIKSLFGGSNIIKTIVGAVDDYVFTDQEKSEVQMQVMALELKKLDVSKKLRRTAGQSVIFVWVFCIIISVILSIFGQSDKVNEIIAIGNAYELGWSFIAVIGFLFTKSQLNKREDTKLAQIKVDELKTKKRDSGDE